MFEKKYVMTNEHMWEKEGKKHACRLCGQYIRNQEEFYFIIVPMPWRENQPNFIVHAHEWEDFKKGLSTDDEIFSNLLRVKKPKTKNQTKVDERKVEAFKRVLSKRRYKIKKETRQRIYFKVSKNLAVFYFDKRFGTIEFCGKDKGLFDRIFLNEFISQLQKEWEQEIREEEGSDQNKNAL